MGRCVRDREDGGEIMSEKSKKLPGSLLGWLQEKCVDLGLVNAEETAAKAVVALQEAKRKEDAKGKVLKKATFTVNGNTFEVPGELFAGVNEEALASIPTTAEDVQVFEATMKPLSDSDTAAMERGAERLRWTLRGMRGDGRCWKCLKGGCAGTLQVVKEEAMSQRTGEWLEERWGCLLCGSVFEERALAEAHGLALKAMEGVAGADSTAAGPGSVFKGEGAQR